MIELKQQLQKWRDQNDYEKIIKAVKRIPEEERDFNFVKQLAWALNNTKCYEEALAVLETERQQGEDDPDWNFEMGWAYYHRPYIKNGAMVIDKLSFTLALSYFTKAKELGSSSTDHFIHQCKMGLEWLERDSHKHNTTKKDSTQPKKTRHVEWKSKIDENCVEEVEDMIISSIKAGFLSNDEIQEECEEYIAEEYPDHSKAISSDEWCNIVIEYRNKFQNTGKQENFLKLDSAFHNMGKNGLVALHCAGYTQSDGFNDCNEIASERYEEGEKVVGCCFYTLQDLEHILHEESTSLYLSFGNYFDTPSAEEVGQQIVKALESTSFSIQWNLSADTKIEIMNLVWDKQFSEK